MNEPNPARYHLAQANIAKMIEPKDSERMKSFYAQLDAVNAVADESAGFVWRFIEEEDDDRVVRVFGDPLILFNMSVWQSVTALHEYVYRGAHLAPMRERRRWFEKPTQPTMVLWWVPAGHIPSVQDAYDRLEHLRANGPSAQAFTFREPFPAPGEEPETAPEVDPELCGQEG